MKWSEKGSMFGFGKSKKSEEDSKPVILIPLLPLRDIVIFPHMVVPLFVGRTKSINALTNAMNSGKNIFLVAQKKAAIDEPAEKDMYKIGTIGTILQLLRLPDGTVKALIERKKRPDRRKKACQNRPICSKR